MKWLFLVALGFALCGRFSERVAAFSTPLSTQTTTTVASPTALFGVRSAVRKVFRRGVKTLEKEETTKKSEDDEPPKEKPWRLMYHDSCDYQPEGVARVLAKLLPTLDRRTAYELCSHARMVGRAVPLLITDRRNAERYAALLRQYGLAATVEPHTMVPK